MTVTSHFLQCINGSYTFTSLLSKRKPLSVISKFLNFLSAPPPKKKTCKDPDIVFWPVLLLSPWWKIKKANRTRKEGEGRKGSAKKRGKEWEGERKKRETSREIENGKERHKKKWEKATNNYGVVEDGLQIIIVWLKMDYKKQKLLPVSVLHILTLIYEDDITDGQLMHEWIQCTHSSSVNV